MERFDLIIIGAGSGNMLLTPDFDDWKVAIVEDGPFGGTCLNRGCIPSKMYVYAAEIAHLAENGPAYGVHSRLDGVDWPAIRDRIFTRIDPIADSGKAYRERLEHVTVYPVRGRFVGDHTLQVGSDTITGDTIVVAAGARASIPEISGLDEVPFHTSDDIMRINELPDRLVVIGGGFIAAELGDVFGAFGVDVEFLVRGPRMLRGEDDDISDWFTEQYRRRYKVRLGTSIERVGYREGRLRLRGSDRETSFATDADMLLVATGRIPNSDELDVGATGVVTDADGYVVVDEHGRTNVPGIWALGDIAYPDQLKHLANATTRMVAHNIAHPSDLRTLTLGAVPHAVFANPQVASVGMTERDVVAAGLPYTKVIKPYGTAAYGWAMEDQDSVCKLIAHARSRQLLGAHIMGPMAATLIQQLIQGMRFGQTVDEMATEQFYIHPAPTEVVEQALLDL